MNKNEGGEEVSVGCLIIIIFGTLIIGVILGYSILPRKIITEEKITPILKLTVEDNVIDTLYIYKNY